MSFLDTLFQRTIPDKIKQLRESILNWYNTPVVFRSFEEGSRKPSTPIVYTSRQPTPSVTRSQPTTTPTQVRAPTPTPIPSHIVELPDVERPYQEAIQKYWQEKANIANQILRYVDPNTGEVLGENTAYQAGPEMDIPNKDGSIDRGLFRVNSNTFIDFMERKPEVLAQHGIYSWDDMLDPIKNAAMARIIYDEQGAGAWYAAPPWLK